MSKRLKAKRALMVAARPLYSKWLASELKDLIAWMKRQYVNSNDALLDNYNRDMLEQLSPHIDRALDYLDIPYNKQWSENKNILLYQFK
tara:strand:- start:1978 stop:2244 length:267 start_codon:yes stop_codon:yes gene_type:complete